MERAEEERREAKDKAPGPQEGRGMAQYWGATEVSNRTEQQVTSPTPQQHRR